MNLPRKMLILGLVAMCFIAAPATYADGAKIGFVNVKKVLENAPQAKAARAMLEKEFAPRDRELVSMQKKLRALEDKLSRDGAVMSTDERAKIERRIVTERRELKRMQDDFREDLNLRRNQEIAKLQRLILEVIVAVAKEGGYDLLFREAVFASTRVDITPTVLERLKADFSKESAAK